MTKHQLGDVIILVPGILGSVLECNGKEVWAPTPGNLMRAVATLGREVKALRLTDDPVGKDDLNDGVVATRLIPDIHMVPGLWTIDGYTGIRSFILQHFDLAEGSTYLEFPYDWRRDNRVAARKLKEFADRALFDARKKNKAAKLVLIAHSMGGLVSRYYLECLDGWKDARTLITFGTPYRGSLNALGFVANGFVKKIGPLKIADLSELLRSLTSVYQLLPRYACINTASGAIQRPAEISGVAHLDATRAFQAYQDFHLAIDKSIEQRPPQSYEVFPVVGTGQPTWQSANLRPDGQVDLQRVRIRADGKAVEEFGDGTVPRVSAIPLELGNDAPSIFTSERHAGLQNVKSVQHHLFGLLTRVPDIDTVREVTSGLTLDLDDLFESDEPIALEVGVSQRNLQLEASIVDLSSGNTVAQPTTLRPVEAVHRFELPPLSPGDYRIRISGTGNGSQSVQPVHGVFSVAARADW